MDHTIDREQEPDKSLVEPLLPPSESVVLAEAPRNLFLRLWDRRRRIRLVDTESEGRSYLPKLKTWSRTKKIVVILLLVTILLVLCVVVPVVVVVTKHHRSHSRVYYPPYPQHERCVKYAYWVPLNDTSGSAHRPHLRYSSSASFTFNRSSDELYFIGGGGLTFHALPYTPGSITFTNDANVGIDDVEVEVVASHNTKYGPLGTDVCTLSQSYSKHGVGIFTPLNPLYYGGDRVFFSINVKLPLPKAGQEGRPLYYGNVRTKLPRFSHHFDDLQGSAEFNTVSLEGSNSPFTVGSLVANRVDINTMNANIEGVFNVTEGVNLRTQNGEIRVNVHMESDGISESHASLYTGNGLIDANLTLVSSAGDMARGAFRVNAGSSNAPIEIAIPTAPVGHTLRLNAYTSQSPVNVHLPLTFEGSFSLASSSAAPPKLEYDPDATDPSGMGRHRIVEYQKTQAGIGRGTVSWSPSHHGFALVDLRAYESSLSLTL